MSNPIDTPVQHQGAPYRDDENEGGETAENAPFLDNEGADDAQQGYQPTTVASKTPAIVLLTRASIALAALALVFDIASGICAVVGNDNIWYEWPVTQILTSLAILSPVTLVLSSLNGRKIKKQSKTFPLWVNIPFDVVLAWFLYNDVSSALEVYYRGAVNCYRYRQCHVLAPIMVTFFWLTWVAGLLLFLTHVALFLVRFKRITDSSDRTLSRTDGSTDDESGRPITGVTITWQWPLRVRWVRGDGADPDNGELQ